MHEVLYVHICMPTVLTGSSLSRCIFEFMFRPEV